MKIKLIKFIVVIVPTLFICWHIAKAIVNRFIIRR